MWDLHGIDVTCTIPCEDATAFEGNPSYIFIIWYN